MKPHPPPLECLGYHVLELHVKANPAHDPTRQIIFDLDDLKVESNVLAPTTTDSRLVWNVVLSIVRDLPPGKNIPYQFMLVLNGQFLVNGEWPSDKMELLVTANASSILFGAARELLRQASSAGPFQPPIFIPTMSFYPRVTAQPKSQETSSVKS